MGSTVRESLEELHGLNRYAQGAMPRIPDEVIDGIIYRDSLAILGIT